MFNSLAVMCDELKYDNMSLHDRTSHNYHKAGGTNCLIYRHVLSITQHSQAIKPWIYLLHINHLWLVSISMQDQWLTLYIILF